MDSFTVKSADNGYVLFADNPEIPGRKIKLVFESKEELITWISENLADPLVSAD